MRKNYQYQDGQVSYHHSLDVSPDPGQFSMHAHEQHEIYYFVSGRASYIVEGNEYRLEGGSLMIMRAGEVHKPNIQPGYAYERMALNFGNELLRAIDPDGLLARPFLDRPLGIGNYYPRALIRSSFVYECMKGMECTGSRQQQRVALLANLYPILAEILRVYDLGEKPAAFEPVDRMQEVITYINNHLSEDLSVDLLASHFYLSKPQLSRRFKQATGTSIWEYVIIKRLMRVRRLVGRGERVMNAAQQCGFRDYSAFYRAYKGRYGCSPLEDKGPALVVDSFVEKPASFLTHENRSNDVHKSNEV